MIMPEKPGLKTSVKKLYTVFVMQKGKFLRQWNRLGCFLAFRRQMSFTFPRAVTSSCSKAFTNYNIQPCPGPEETEVVTIDELLNVENDILVDAIEEDENSDRNALVEIATSASNVVQNTENIDDNDDGDGGPSKCYLYKTKRCEYQDKDSEPSKTMKWIGCDFLSCSNTFHEKCVGLSFSNDEARKLVKLYFYL